MSEISPTASGSKPSTYSQGHTKAVLSSHESRTVENSAQFLVPHIKPDFRILDVGCGPGTITAGLARLVPYGSVIGVDLSPDVCARARVLHPENQYGNLFFRPHNILATTDDQAANLGAQTFDVIFTSQTIIHLPDPVLAIRNMRALLKPGGVLAMRETRDIIWTPSLPGLQLYDRALDAMMRSSGAPGLYGARDILQWAIEAGFEEAKVEVQTGSTIYASDGERKWWAEGIKGRFEEDFGKKIQNVEVDWPEELGAGKRAVGVDGANLIKEGLEKWSTLSGARYEAVQSEVLSWR